MNESKPPPWWKRPWGARWKVLILTALITAICTTFTWGMWQDSQSQKWSHTLTVDSTAVRFVSSYLASGGMTAEQRRMALTTLSTPAGDLLDAMAPRDPGTGHYVSTSGADHQLSSGNWSVTVRTVDAAQSDPQKRGSTYVVTVTDDLKIVGVQPEVG